VGKSCKALPEMEDLEASGRPGLSSMLGPSFLMLVGVHPAVPHTLDLTE